MNHLERLKTRNATVTTSLELCSGERCEMLLRLRHDGERADWLVREGRLATVVMRGWTNPQHLQDKTNKSKCDSRLAERVIDSQRLMY